MATESLSLLEFLRHVVTDVRLRDWFAQDPHAALRAYGLDDLSPQDVHDALVLAEDNQTADFSRDYASGPHAVSWTPPPVPHDTPSHDTPSHDAVRYFTSYVTNNRDAHGGDFDHDVDVHSAVASGDGPVAAGYDIAGSTGTTGHGTVADPGDDTTAFGAGNAAGTTVGGEATVGDGGAFASGGGAAVDTSDHSRHDVGRSWTDASVHDSYRDYSDHGVDGSHDTDVDAGAHHSYDRSPTTTAEGSHHASPDPAIEHH